MGALLCLVSAAAFGCMAIFGKLAYEHDVAVADLLLARFLLAAVALAVIAGATGALRGVPRRTVVNGLLMGAVGYATQAGLYFLALERMDASLLALLLYTYPAMVTGAAIVLRRERATSRRLAALATASAGTALVLVGAGTGALDPLGTALGIAAAVVYSVYILTGERVLVGASPLGLAALVTAGAAATFTVVGLLRGGPHLGFDAGGWGWVTAIALVSTVTAIVTFFGGLARVGPSTASILSTFEPVVTVSLAAAAFGETLAPVQVLGGVLVLGAVVLLQARRRGAPARDGRARAAAAQPSAL
jgi:drug/metabolite transporter (DMT)-like permease